MKIKRFKYSTMQEAMEKFPLAYVMSLYVRPDGDNYWEDYKEDQKFQIRNLKRLLKYWNEKRIVLKEFTVIYFFNGSGWEWTGILEFENQGRLQLFPELNNMVPLKKVKEYWRPFDDGLGNAECMPQISLHGVEVQRLIISEVY